MRRLLLAVPIAFALATPAFADPEITITLKDDQFVPADVPVPAGVKVKLIVKNEMQRSAEFESPALHREKVMTAGGQISMPIGPLDAGNYEFFDDFNKASRGQLVVK